MDHPLSYNASVGLLGRIEWTDDETLRAVKSKKFRYMSPVVFVHKPTGRVTGLHSVALTNVPAIRGMVSIAASRRMFGSVRRPARTDQGAWGRWPASAPWE